jgi:bifunctional N-acetylglucosamine-1-phosphate-uridyltransferase/glucosamine-1-phosphate-acetyltransferase GlmU-like protein
MKNFAIVDKFLILKIKSVNDKTKDIRKVRRKIEIVIAGFSIFEISILYKSFKKSNKNNNNKVLYLNAFKITCIIEIKNFFILQVRS